MDAGCQVLNISSTKKKKKVVYRSYPAHGVTTMAASDESRTLEYSTLFEARKLLITHIKTELGDICDALFQKEYIPSEVKDVVETIGIPNEQKARRLVDTLLERVEIDPNIYYGFINILKDTGPWEDTIIKKLEELFQRHVQRKASVSGRHIQVGNSKT